MFDEKFFTSMKLELEPSVLLVLVELEIILDHIVWSVLYDDLEDDTYDLRCESSLGTLQISPKLSLFPEASSWADGESA